MNTPSVTLIGTGPELWIVGSLVPGGTPGGQAVAATIQANPTEAPQTQLLVPGSEEWHIEDIFAEGGVLTTDMGLLARINRIPQTWVPSYNGSLQALLTRLFLRRTIGIARGSQVTFQVVPWTLVGTSDIQVVWYLYVTRYSIGS